MRRTAAHIGRDRVADRLLVEPARQLVLVKRAVAAQIDLVDSVEQRRKRLLDDPAVARPGRDPSGQARGQAIAVAELAGEDDVLLSPQSQYRLIAAIAVIGTLGRPFVAGNHCGINVKGRRPHRPGGIADRGRVSALALARPSSGTRRRPAPCPPAAAANPRHGIAPENRRGLRCRQVVPQQQRQRLVVAELIEILGPLTTAAHIVSRLSTTSEVLSLRLRLFSLISRSITAAVPV